MLRTSGAWVDGKDHCGHFGGRMATLEDMAAFQKWVNAQQTTFWRDETMELWVGASLHEGNWTWQTKDSRVQFNGRILTTK